MSKFKIINKVDNLIGIVGLGFVGSAVYNGYIQLGVKGIKTYDINLNSNCATLKELVTSKIKYIFLCLPTPKINHFSDFSGIIRTCQEIVELSKQKIIIIKSTILPENISALQKMLGIHIVANPEFLTQRTAMEDFLAPSRIIWGCDNEKILKEVSTNLGTNFFNCPNYKVNLKLAMKCKYAANSFGFIKILYFNMIRKWVKNQEEYDILKNTILDSKWVAGMHTTVPGPDGEFGIGGACLPKDIFAMYEEFNNLKLNGTKFLEEAMVLNEHYRN